MLSKIILQDISRLTRLKLYQQEKHYLQTLILSSIYSQISDELIFKGGTALFFIVGLPRFSEDLDFTCTKSFDFNQLTEKTHRDLELMGVKNQIRKPETTPVSFAFKIAAEGPLFTQEIERCFVAIDISLREEVIQKTVQEISSPYPDVLPFSVQFMGTQEIAAEKVRAIMTRNKARDVYDLHELLKRKVELQKPLIDKKLAYYQKKFTSAEFVKKLNEKKEIWDAELKSLVIGILPSFSEAKKLILERMKKV